VAMSTASHAGDMAAALPRMAWMALGYVLYFGAFVGVSLAVSAWTKSTRAALLVLLAFWMFNGLIAPRAATDTVRFLRPAPSAFEFGHKIETALRAGLDGHDPLQERVARLEAQLLRKHKVDRIEQLPINFNGVRLQEGENHGNVVFDQAYAELWKIFSEQDALNRGMGLLAPSLAVRSLSMGFAGTDFAQHVHFAKVAEDYRRLMQRMMNEDLIQNASNTDPYLAGDSVWRKVPEFTYTAPGAGWVAERQIPAFGVLALWFLGSTLAVVVAMRRMQVSE
jgi:ABC-2 type transport system permease protein